MYDYVNGVFDEYDWAQPGKNGRNLRKNVQRFKGSKVKTKRRSFEPVVNSITDQDKLF